VVVQSGDLWLESATTRTRVLTTAGVPLLRNVARVREWLADSALAWRELDARVSTRFFVLKETT
jgi:hypothetical protein